MRQHFFFRRVGWQRCRFRDDARPGRDAGVRLIGGNPHHLISIKPSFPVLVCFSRRITVGVLGARALIFFIFPPTRAGGAARKREPSRLSIGPGTGIREGRPLISNLTQV